MLIVSLIELKQVLSEDVILKSGKKLLFNDEKTRNVSYSNIQDKNVLQVELFIALINLLWKWGMAIIL